MREQQLTLEPIQHVSGRRTATERRLVPPTWPLAALIYGYPVWWLLGITSFLWPLTGIFCAIQLAVRRDTRVPRTFGVWLLFLLMVLGSATRLEPSADVIVYAYRATVYFSGTALLLWVLNVPPVVPSSKIVDLLVTFWVIVVIGGFIGLVFGSVQFTSLFQRVFPEIAAKSGYLKILTDANLAEVQTFIGYTIVRPSAPFPYTNWWGGIFAALIPFVFSTMAGRISSVRRAALASLLVLTVVPAVASVNRGMWASLGLGLVYFVIRLGMSGRIAAMAAALMAAIVIVVLVLASPLGGLVRDRLADEGSVPGRTIVVTQTISGVLDSPIFGHGVPAQAQRRTASLAVGGTSGMAWLILYTAGIPAVIFFLSWLGIVLLRTVRIRHQTSTSLACEVSLVIVIPQLFFYEMIPVEFMLLMVIAGLALREVALATNGQTHQRGDHRNEAGQLVSV
jgi:polysaccharide biosynthesis protein PslJ